MSQTRTEDIQECEDCVPPADAFSIIGNETRLSVLEALWRLETPARFSDVRAEVGMRDSAQFNYHLGELTDQFVRKTDGGYELRTAGVRVVQSVLAGSFTEHPRREIDIDDPCVACGATLSAHYEDEQLTVECPACGHGHGQYSFPPGGLHDRTDEEVLEAFDQRVRHLHCLSKDGVCPACNGRTETRIQREEDCCLGTDGFHREHGVELSETPYWRLDWCVSSEPVTARSEEPWRLRVDVEAGGETMRVTLDGDLSIVETERV
ncbi:ArsR family transcriptional regulator [Halobacteriales archaeon SW_5_70_135]|nr:MAG: ArsR family transcriptional regulator [Halobacteriales archaeon SW_5_70_135]